MDSRHIQGLDQAFVLPTYKRQPGVYVRGSGTRLWDSEGHEYLDFLAGIAVNQLGHCHPAIVETITRQATTLVHTSNHLLTPPQPLLAQKLCTITGMEKTFFSNDGTTAVEAALKIAKKHSLTKLPDGSGEIISLHRSFHGRSMGALSATAQAKYQDPFRPLVPHFKHIAANDLAELRAAVGSQAAAVILEPIQGEGGLTTLSDEFIREARRLTTENDALLIVDEVQTGMGRTGTWLAIQQNGIVADIVCLAKALGGGLPIGSCLTRGVANSVLSVGEHGSTFGGNALVCAVALTVIEVIEREGLMENARNRGEQLALGLANLPGVIEVRGKGLMRGAILEAPLARQTVAKALEEGLIINATDEHTLRFVPSLIVSADEVDRCLETLCQVLRSL